MEQTNYNPQRFWKMKRQLRKARAEIAAQQQEIEFWIKETANSRQLLSQERLVSQGYKTTNEGFYNLLAAKDVSFDKLLALLEDLTEENQRLKRQQAAAING